MKNISKKYMIYITLGIVALIGAVAIGTWALFFRVAVQQTTNIISSLECVEVKFNSLTDSIDINAAYPLTDIEGKASTPYIFKIKNNCNTYVEYQLIASVVTKSNNVPINYVKVALDGQASLSPINLSSIPTLEQIPPELNIGMSSHHLLTDGSFDNQQEHTYEYRMWLDGENPATWNDPIFDCDHKVTGSCKNLQIKLSIIGVTKTKPTICSENPSGLACKILTDNGGIELIEAKSAPDFSIMADSDQLSGMWSAPDDYGTSYYFRGTHTGIDNNAIFAGHHWKIIRVDGKGNIRMIYNGPEGTPGTQLPDSQFNLITNDNKYVGYIVDGSPSTIKTAVDNFYNNLSAHHSKIATTTYCNDRSIEVGYYSPIFNETNTALSGAGSTVTIYGSTQRLEAQTPTLICPESVGKLQLPIGLITADEIMYAGSGGLLSYNSSYYLNINSPYWTLSPMFFGFDTAVILYEAGGVIIGGFGVSFPNGLRPVIALRHDTVLISGNGSASNPYKV